MVEEMIEIVSMDLIKFPREYSGKGSIRVYESNGGGEENEESYKDIILSDEQEAALYNIDTLKTEVTSIHRFTNNSSKNVYYALPKDKENKMHDDRFYTFIMLCHFLYQLRREDNFSSVMNSDAYTFQPLYD